MVNNDTLEKVCNTSFPANHLLQVSLVKRINTAPDDYKEKCMFFVTMAPGETTSNGANNRTYNFSKHISIKYSIREIIGLSFVLKSAAVGRTDVMPYVKFSGDATAKKYVSVRDNIDKKDDNTEKRYVSLTISNGTIKPTINFTPDQAYACGIMLEKMYEKAIQLEFDYNQLTPEISKEVVYKKQQPRNNYKKEQIETDFKQVFNDDVPF